MGSGGEPRRRWWRMDWGVRRRCVPWRVWLSWRPAPWRRPGRGAFPLLQSSGSQLVSPSRQRWEWGCLWTRLPPTTIMHFYLYETIIMNNSDMHLSSKRDGRWRQWAGDPFFQGPRFNIEAFAAPKKGRWSSPIAISEPSEEGGPRSSRCNRGWRCRRSVFAFHLQPNHTTTISQSRKLIECMWRNSSVYQCYCAFVFHATDPFIVYWRKLTLRIPINRSKKRLGKKEGY